MELIMEEYGAMIVGVVAVVIMAGLLLGLFMQDGMVYQLLCLTGEGVG